MSAVIRFPPPPRRFGAGAAPVDLPGAPAETVPDDPPTSAQDELLTFQRLYAEAMAGPPLAFWRAWCWHAARILRGMGWS